MTNIPVFYVDDVMYYIDGPEFKVLFCAVHKIIGDKIPFDGLQEATISVSDFCAGTHLGRVTVCEALKGLIKYNLIVPIGSVTREGQRWQLSRDFDVEGLKARKAEKDEKIRKRMEKVRKNKPASSAPGAGGDRVYLIEMGDSGHFKIGHSTNPRQRIQEFNTPFPIKFICAIECENAVSLEAELHAIFKDKRMRAEWFALSRDDVEYIKGLAAQS